MTETKGSIQADKNDIHHNVINANDFEYSFVEVESK